MKTKIKVELQYQPLFKVYLSSPAKSGWFLCNANSESEALLLAKQAYPTYKIGNCLECLENWSICWSN